MFSSNSLADQGRWQPTWGARSRILARRTLTGRPPLSSCSFGSRDRRRLTNSLELESAFLSTEGPRRSKAIHPGFEIGVRNRAV